MITMKKPTKVTDESETALTVAPFDLNHRPLDDRRVRRRGGGGVLDSGGGGVLDSGGGGGKSNGGTFDGGGGGSGSCVEHEVQSIAANF
jgi:hypothetical protein